MPSPLARALPPLLLLMLPAQAAAGVIVNGSFESGGVAGWQAAGDVSAVTAAVGVPPPSGAHQAFLTTASRDGDAFNFSGSDAASAPSLEALLGLSAGALGGNEGSALRQSFTASAGEVLTFAYNFLTAEGGQNDFAFVLLSGPGIQSGGQALEVLADRGAASAPSAVVLDPVFGDPARETGYRTYSHTFLAAGTYTLGVGVLDAGLTTSGDPDVFVPSALLLDDFRVGPALAVPEPGSLALAGIAAACLGGYAWRRRGDRPRPPA